MTELDQALAEFRSLRDQSRNALIATQGSSQSPEASYAPIVWHDASGYLFLSELASHTRNLRHNPAIGLLLLEDEASVQNPFARRRISLQGQVHLVAREDQRFAAVIDLFHRQFGKVMELIEPLPDFHLFRVEIHAGRYIRGFGQAYELAGADLDTLCHVDPRQ